MSLLIAVLAISTALVGIGVLLGVGFSVARAIVS